MVLTSYFCGATPIRYEILPFLGHISSIIKPHLG